ncbi:MAG: efflux RND transporter permease subunit [Microbacteriaceae bacterium]
MNVLAKYSLKNRALIALVTIVISIFGAISLTSLKQELIPSITLPQVFVITSYPGASPEVVANDVSLPIETAVRGIAGLESTSSTSSANSSRVVVAFQYGYDLISAEQKVQQAINRISRALPDGVEPLVFTGSLDDLPILQIAASGLDTTELTRNLELSVIPALKKIDGVRDASVSGAIGQRITIVPDQTMLNSLGVTTQRISQTLQQYGVLIPAGSVSTGDNTAFIQVGSKLSSAAQIADLPLQGVPGMTLGDVAEIKLVDNPITSISRVNGKDALSISVTKEPGANTVTVSNAVKDALPDLAKVAGGVTFIPVFDQAPFIEQSIETLAVEGLLGLAFAILIILLFLFSIRSTLVTAISIPTSVLITFIGMQVSGYSLNILTLGALTISIGRVVDDSIVVVENIKRHLIKGADRTKAILTAVREVAGAITASTVTTVAVFLPIALVSGMAGELFRPFSLTVTIALAASLLVSLTIVPVLAYWFLKPSKVGEHGANPDGDSGGAETRLQRAYLPVLRGTLKYPALTVLGAVLVLGGTVALVPSMKTNYIGDSGQNTLSVTQQVPSGSSLGEQSKLALDVEKVLQANTGVVTVQTNIGNTGGIASLFGGGSATSIRYSLTLDADADPALLQQELRQALVLLEKDGVSFSLSAAGGGMGVSSAIEIDVQGSDAKAIEAATKTLVTEFTKSGTFAEVSSNLSDTQPTVEIIVDRKMAAGLGLSDVSLGMLVSQQLQPSQIGQLKIDGESVRIYLVDADAPTTLDGLRALELNTPLGPIALSDIAAVNLVQSPSSVATVDGVQSQIVTVLPNDENLGAASGEIANVLDTITLPVGVTASIGGIAAEQADSFNQLGIALLLAILIVYVVMVATFRSLRQPLLLLVSVPFAATGAIGMLLITDSPLGVASIIGVLMLVGIVVTNSIVMIDLVNQYRDRGMKAKLAVVLGASRRLRPILMTALATILALTPMALGLTGHGGFISQPLALVVIGGLISSTVLTLIVLPSLYWWVEGAKERRMEKHPERYAARAAAHQEATPVLVGVGAEEPVRSESSVSMPNISDAVGPNVPAPSASPDEPRDFIAEALAEVQSEQEEEKKRGRHAAD